MAEKKHADRLRKMFTVADVQIKIRDLNAHCSVYGVINGNDFTLNIHYLILLPVCLLLYIAALFEAYVKLIHTSSADTNGFVSHSNNQD